MYNTPPVYGIYIMSLVLEWLDGLGGLTAAEKMAEERSSTLNRMMDKHAGFYKWPVPEHCRSKMKVVFRMPSEDLEKRFIAEEAQAGMGGLKGHRSVGGCRASIYNAMPIEGTKTLASFMDPPTQ